MIVNEAPTFPVLTDLAEGLRVKLDGSGNAVAADEFDGTIGTLPDIVVFANTQISSIIPSSKPGVRRMIANGAISQYAEYGPADDGKIQSGGTDGIVLEAASADGDLILVLPYGAPSGQIDLQVDSILFTDCRVHDALATLLPAAAANDDMGLVTGTPGTDAPTLQGVDFGGTSTDEKCAFIYELPSTYRDGETITVRCHAGMLTTVSDGTATLDCEVWKQDGTGAVGSDICATAAQSINSLTFADIDFTVTPTGLVAGDILVIRLSFGGSDTGNAGVMIPEIAALKVLRDVDVV